MTTYSPEIIAERLVVGTKLYGGKSNHYYARPDQRMITVRITRNIENLYRVLVILPNHNSGYASELFASAEEARADANRVYVFVRDVFHGQMCDDEGSRIAGNNYKITLCPQCGHYNTLKTKQEAYGDRTTCHREECGYENWYSIGD